MVIKHIYHTIYESYILVSNFLLLIVMVFGGLGFEVADKGCCGSGNLEVSILCNPLSLGICSNRSNYVFWDSFHPTEKAYQIITSQVFDKNVDKFF